MALFGVLQASEFRMLFKKKFANFCQKSPLNLTFRLFDDKVIIYQPLADKSFTYIFDFSLSESDNIASIKKELLKDYPIISLKENVLTDLSVEEKFREIGKGIPIEEVLLLKKEKESLIRYLIDKRFDDTNQVLLVNLDTKAKSIWSLSIPVTTFINRVYDSTVDICLLFKQKASFIKEVK